MAPLPLARIALARAARVRAFCALRLGAVLLLAAVSAPAQTVRPGVFADYDSLRAELDALIADRAIQDMLARFGGNDASLQDMMAAEARLRATYPGPLSNVALLREGQVGEGFRQQLLAYWGAEDAYLYVHLLLHDREDGTYALQLNVNSDPRMFLPLF